MKQALSTAATAMITGIFFAGGVALVIWIYATFIEESSHKELVHIDYPEGLTIAEHQLVKDTHKLTVQGKLQNDTEILWDYLWIEVIVFAGVQIIE